MRPSFLDTVYLSESPTADRAKSMGMEYMLVARWGKNGVSMYRQSHGELIPIKKNISKHHPAVHDSPDLMYLTNTMHHEEFKSIETKKDSCLVNQVVHSVAMQLGISPKDIFDQYYPKSVGGMLSLESIFKGIQNKVTINGKKISLELHDTPDIDSALEIVKMGVPVLVMVKTNGSIMKGTVKKDGIVHPVKARPPANDTFHALMLIGVDKKNDHAIFRDSEHEHLNKAARETGGDYTPGFLKVDKAYLKTNKQAVAKYLKVSAVWK